MLKQRLWAAAVLLPLFWAALFHLPSAGWELLTLIVILIGAWEWARLMRYRALMAAMFFLGVLLLVVLLKWKPGLMIYAVSLSFGFWLLLAPLWLALRWPLKQPLLLAGIGWLVLVPTWGAFTVGRDYFGANGLLFLLGIVWVADSAAYFAGRRFGKHKLAPAISPGKTWEGALGALSAVAIYTLLATVMLGWPYRLDWVAAAELVLAVWLLTAVGVVGDLFESWLKREANVKDSGALIPGHGGVLDRIDSLTAAVPVALALAYWFPLRAAG